MDDEPGRIEVRLRVLEALVAFQFAAQHMLNTDPAASIKRLREVLVDGAERTTFANLPPELAERAAAELGSAIDRIVRLQEQLPRRLVD